MRAICRAVSKWGGSGSSPSFSLTVQEVHSMLLPYLGLWVQGPKGARVQKGARAHTDLISALNSRRTSTVGSAVLLPLGSPGYISV